MIRLTILLLTFSVFANGQDSLLVRETCKKISELKNPDDLMEQANIVSGQLMNYVPTIENTPKEKRVKTVYTFQYRLHRELQRTCPRYVIGMAPKIGHRVIDLEDKFTRSEIDSLTTLCVDLSKSRNIFVYVVTIDDYFPDKDITDFSNRNRERWGQRGGIEKGNVMIAVSLANGEIRLSTSDISTKFLTDEKCKEINKVIIPYFQEGQYFKGLVSGLRAIEKSL